MLSVALEGQVDRCSVGIFTPLLSASYAKGASLRIGDSGIRMPRDDI